MLDVVGELRYEAGKPKDCQVQRELETRERARSLQDDQKKTKSEDEKESQWLFLTLPLNTDFLGFSRSLLNLSNQGSCKITSSGSRSADILEGCRILRELQAEANPSG